MNSLLADVSYYENSRINTGIVYEKELNRRLLLRTATLFRTILLSIEQLNSKDYLDKSNIKQDLSKAQHEKKQLESKITILTADIDTWKKKSSNQAELQKENQQLRSQINKLTNDLTQSKNEITKSKQQFATQKAVLESKLENAKRAIKSLKDQKPLSPSKVLQPPSISSPAKAKPSGIIHTKPLQSNFSTSPFLAKLKQNADTPAGQVRSKNVLATSTPDGASPIKDMNQQKISRPSGLKNLLFQNKPGTEKSKASLFDDDVEDEEDDLFTDSITKIKPKKTEESNSSTIKVKEQPKRRSKRRIAGKQIVVEEDVDELKLTPAKKTQLFDKLGGISPLKQRNKERSLFKV